MKLSERIGKDKEHKLEFLICVVSNLSSATPSLRLFALTCYKLKNHTAGKICVAVDKCLKVHNRTDQVRPEAIQYGGGLYLSGKPATICRSYWLLAEGPLSQVMDFLCIQQVNALATLKLKVGII